MTEAIDPIAGIQGSDTVIALMGPRGAGKSHFVDVVTGIRGLRTNKPSSFRVQATRVAHNKLGNRLVLVELPGLGESVFGVGEVVLWSDLQALQEISAWLRTTYERGIRLAGIIYLQHITDDPATTRVQKNLRLLSEICGNAAIKKTINMVLVTTMWDTIEKKIGIGKERELQAKLWKQMIDTGAKMDRLTSANSGQVIIERAASRKKKGLLLLQHELVVERKTLQHTQAGHSLFIALSNLIEHREQVLNFKLYEMEASNDLKTKSNLKAQCDEVRWELEEAKKDVETMKTWDGRPKLVTDVSSRLSTPANFGSVNRVESFHSETFGVQSFFSHESSGSTTPLLDFKNPLPPRKQTNSSDVRLSSERQKLTKEPTSIPLGQTSATDTHLSLKDQSPPSGFTALGVRNNRVPTDELLPPIAQERVESSLIPTPFSHGPPNNYSTSTSQKQPWQRPLDTDIAAESPQSSTQPVYIPQKELSLSEPHSAPELRLPGDNTIIDQGSLPSNQDSESLSHPSVLEQSKGMIRTRVLDIAANAKKRGLLTGLRTDDAQCMADYLNQILSDGSSLDVKQKKHVLSLLSRITRSAQIFPTSYELTGVECDLSQPQNDTGGFSLIYKGVYDRQAVCVKAVRRWQMHDEKQDRVIQAQIKELILWSHFSHPNVLPFHGVFNSREELPRICIVSPWMENGDLVDFLKTFPGTPKMPLISDVVTGLQYLHEYGVIHGDLKAKNVLISSDKRAMIADFGLSNVTMTLVSTNRDFGGTTHWMAPELLTEDDPRGTMPSDIWSFGCVCYEVLTGNIPFHEYPKYSQLIYAFTKSDRVTPFTVRKPHEKKVKEEELEKIGIGMQVIMGMCWEDVPTLRPTAEMLRRAIVRLRGADNRSQINSPTPSSAKIPTSESHINYDRLSSILRRILENPQSTSENPPTDFPVD